MHGTWRTLDRATELGVGGVELFYRSMELWLELGVSFVAEQTFYRGVSEPDVIARLAPHATSSRCTARACTPRARWRQRMEADPFCGRTGSRKLLPVIERLDAELVEPLDFACPVDRRSDRRRLRPAARGPRRPPSTTSTAVHRSTTLTRCSRPDES